MVLFADVTYVDGPYVFRLLHPLVDFGEYLGEILTILQQSLRNIFSCHLFHVGFRVRVGYNVKCQWDVAVDYYPLDRWNVPVSYRLV